MVNRLISLNKTASSLWFGPRQSGKSTLIRQALAHEPAWEVNLLETDVFQKYLKDPSQFRRDALYQIKTGRKKFIFIDEIQRISELTNEVQTLMDKNNTIFVMSGSSARKLKRGNANLLGGRAIVQNLFSLTARELGEKFALNSVLQHGSLVGIYFDPPEIRSQKLRAYVDTYLKEEIAQEGLVRNFASFHRFLDVAAAVPTELLNFANIARESGTSLKTVQNYFSILYETLIAFELPCWDRSVRRQLSRHPKFYFVDCGINNAVSRLLNDPLPQPYRGRMFEQWFINEVRAHLSYRQSDCLLHYWRTARGEFEVDLVISKAKSPIVAIEIKGKKSISLEDLKGLLEFRKDYPNCQLICACEVNQPSHQEGILITPALDAITAVTAVA